MVGVRLFYHCYFFTYSVVLLLWVCLHYVEGSSGKHVIHKNVGDTVELSPGLPTKNVTSATWKYRETTAARKDGGVPKTSPFKNRSELSFEDFTFTVRKLTLNDSGDFVFASAVDDKQRPSVTFTLHVHEPIIQEPVIKITSTWIASNESCNVSLACSATGNVTYSWIVGNQTLTGSKQQHIIREQDGETTVTCTVSNYVSEKSAFKTVTCSKDMSLILFVGGAAGSLTLFIIFSIIVGVCCCKKRHDGSDTNDLTVYADIGDIANEDGSSTTAPCSLYETIDNRGNSVKPGPQTVYDKIQLNRVRKTSVSPYQEVS